MFKLLVIILVVDSVLFIKKKLNFLMKIILIKRLFIWYIYILE